jgi:hypothetical protein
VQGIPARVVYRGTSPIRKRPPPYDPPMTLGLGLRYGLTGVRFLTSEVPLYSVDSLPMIGNVFG